MKSVMSMWVCMLLCGSSPVLAAPGRSDPQPPGKALGHQNAANPHYVAPVQDKPTFDVCPFIQSAPHMCVNFNPPQ